MSEIARTIIEYKTVTVSGAQTTSIALDARVNELLPEWQPYKKQSVNDMGEAYQVMVRYEKGESIIAAAQRKAFGMEIE